LLPNKPTFSQGLVNTLANFNERKRKGLCSIQSATSVGLETNLSAFAPALELVYALSEGALLRLMNSTMKFWGGYC